MSGFETLSQPPTNCVENRKVFFFDVDNTLYPESLGIGNLMVEYIRDYIEKTLKISEEQADKLQARYYHDYGLAIEGLVSKNHVDAMDYNAKVDDALPLEDFLEPRKTLTELFESFDRTKVKLWLCTNAYRSHGLRVARLLGIEKYFEGITYCDYEHQPLICKPMPEFFQAAMNDAGVLANKEVTPSGFSAYFVDDSEANVEAAATYGWRAVHLKEPKEQSLPPNLGEILDSVPLLPPAKEGGLPQIQYLEQLPRVFPELFKKQ